MLYLKRNQKQILGQSRLQLSGMLCVVMLLSALAGGFASAQDGADDDRKKIIYRKKSTVDFGDAVIEGKGTNPEGIYVVSPPQRKFKGLLRLRTNFHKELIRDSLLLK